MKNPDPWGNRSNLTSLCICFFQFSGLKKHQPFFSEVPTVQADCFVDWFDDVLQLLRKDFPKRSIFPSQTPNQKNQSARPIQRRSFCLEPLFLAKKACHARLSITSCPFKQSPRAISRDERLKSDAWHGNALLSCGPHKLVPQQKLSEFNGELVAGPKVSTFGVYFLSGENWKWFLGVWVTSKMV